MLLTGRSRNGVKKMMEPAVLRWYARKPADDGECRQDDKGTDHHHRRFMHMFGGVMIQT